MPYMMTENLETSGANGVVSKMSEHLLFLESRETTRADKLQRGLFC